MEPLFQFPSPYGIAENLNRDTFAFLGVGQEFMNDVVGVERRHAELIHIS
jgi:hypothetical protein